MRKCLGAPTKFLGHDNSIDSDVYNFYAGNGLWSQVDIMNGLVQRVVYCSKSRSFLLNNADQFLQKNLTGFWGQYDDGRGRKL
jgi:hypothetical protein